VRLYIFKSNANANANLRAFAADAGGSKLPDQFRPWRAIGVVRPENAPPYSLSRDEIEKAIYASGFQLWRIKPRQQ